MDFFGNKKNRIKKIGKIPTVLLNSLLSFLFFRFLKMEKWVNSLLSFWIPYCPFFWCRKSIFWIYFFGTQKWGTKIGSKKGPFFRSKNRAFFGVKNEHIFWYRKLILFFGLKIRAFFWSKKWSKKWPKKWPKKNDQKMGRFLDQNPSPPKTVGIEVIVGGYPGGIEITFFGFFLFKNRVLTSFWTPKTT